MPPRVHDMESDSDFRQLLAQPLLDAIREDLLNLLKFQRMERLLFALHLLFCEIFPWIAILLLFGRMEEVEKKPGSDAFRFLCAFLIGPAVTFLAGSLAVCALAFVPFIKAKVIGTNFIFFSLPQKIYRFTTLCSALQCVCALVVWSAVTLFFCRSDEGSNRSFLKDLFNGTYFTNECHQEEFTIFHTFRNFWLTNQVLLQKILWLEAKAVCLGLQYAFLMEQLRLWLITEIVHLEEELEEVLEEAMDDMLGTTCSLKCHPDPLRLHHSVQKIEDDQIPEEFLCPISKEVCLQPTIAVSGFTYDLPNIVRWIGQSDRQSDEPKDPITREPISYRDLYPNLALRKSILRWNEELISASTRISPKIPINTAEDTKSKVL